MDYAAFIERKSQLAGDHGFEPTWMPGCLFDATESARVEAEEVDA